MVQIRPEAFATLGELLKYLRRRERLTQRDLALAVGYSEAQISRLENNQRLPDTATLTALFIPALGLEREPALAARLVELAAEARGRPARQITVTRTIEHRIDEVIEETWTLQSVPSAPPAGLARSGAQAHLRERLAARRAVALVGLPGVGKTTLAAALAREHFDREPVFWLTLVRGVTDTAPAITRQLAIFLLSRGEAGMEALVGGPAAAEAPPPPDQQWARIAAGLSRRPSLLCFDDAHVALADDRVATLFAQLAATPPIALLLISREAVTLPDVSQVTLAGLDRTDGAAFLERLGAALAPAHAERLLERTTGNPMLLKLAVGALTESRLDPAALIARLENQPQVAAYLIETVLRGLPEAAWKLISLLSVFREPVDLADERLVELSQRADGRYDVRAGIEELQRRHLIDHPNLACLHPLVHDHVYAALVSDLPRRRKLHGVAAEWTEGAPERVVEAAHHYTRAGRWQDAVEVIAGQSEALSNVGQHLAAAAVVDELLAQLRRKDAAGAEVVTAVRRLLTARGDLLRSSLRAPEAEASYREALAMSGPGRSAAPVRARVARSLAQCLLQRGEPDEARRLVREAAATLRPTEWYLLAQLGVIEARACMVLGQYAEAESAARCALERVEPLAEVSPRLTDEIRAQAHRVLGWLASVRPAGAGDSLRHYHRALEAAQRAGMRRVECATLNNLGILLHQRGDLHTASHYLDRALKGVRDLGDEYTAAAVLNNLASVSYLRGDLEAALGQIIECLDITRRLNDFDGLPHSEHQRGMILLAMGRAREAKRLFETTLAEIEGRAVSRARVYLWTGLAEVKALMGEPEAARADLAKAAAEEGARDNAPVWEEIRNVEALIALAGDDAAAARQVIDGGLPEAIGPEIELKRSLIEGMTALSARDPARALDSAARIGEAARQTGYRVYLPGAERLARAAQDPDGRAGLLRIPWGGSTEESPPNRRAHGERGDSVGKIRRSPR